MEQLQVQPNLTRQLLAQEAMAKFTVEKDIAQHIKKTVWPYPSSATTNGPGLGSILVMGSPG